MKKVLVGLLTIITIVLTGCNSEETQPIEEIKYSLYDFDGGYVFDILDLSGELDHYDYIYIVGIFDVGGKPTLMTYGYDVERDEYRTLGEKEVVDCSYVKIVDESGYTPWIIFENDNDYYFEYLVRFGGNEVLGYNNYAFNDLLSDNFDDSFNEFVGYESYLDYIDDNPTSDLESYSLEDYSYIVDSEGYLDIESD